jgi:plastocyanin
MISGIRKERKTSIKKKVEKKMKKILFSAALAGLVVLSFALLNTGHTNAAAADRNSSSDNYQIKIDNFSFTPATLTVPAGTTVTWVNHDDVPHNIVSSEGKTLKSPVMDTDGKFSYTFITAGSYPYYCGIHPKMTGKVVVQ